MKYTTRDLVEMLTYQRDSGSRMEMIFIRKYLDSIPAMRSDRYGNRYIIIGGKQDTMFTAHTDTVHTRNSTRQRVYVHDGIAMTDGRSILGADDTTGVWLLLNLIAEKKPGHYIFQRHEERGGVGSGYSSQRERPHIKKVISLDRKGFTDIITHQGTRTCSDEFANALAKAIGGGYRPSRGGIFTDSANYAYDIPECTNVSIGYLNAHTPRETQSLSHAEWLCKRLLKIDFSKLPVVRDPKEKFDNFYDYKGFDDSWERAEKEYEDWWKKQEKKDLRYEPYEPYNPFESSTTAFGWNSKSYNPKRTKKKGEWW